jgi:N-acyl-D-aspartate/D-glutamate deacylase
MTEASMSDLLIRNATLVDGTGAAPRQADVRVEGAHVVKIADAGTLEPGTAEVVEGDGLLLTPGFVDVHTHYDGQVTWDPILAPSSWHGVTTVVMGNCGVGFAPARPDEHNWLIELMEGVEDIPGAALHEGIQWDWETFPEYLDALEKLPRTIDIAAQVPHGALRAYVMGERGAQQERATAEDLEEMARLVREGIAAGALAFSTNRLPLHTSVHGDPVPGTFADTEELEILTRAAVEGGSPMLQSVPAGAMGEDPDASLREVALYDEISRRTGATVTFSTPQVHALPNQWREVLDHSRAANENGARLVPQVMGRPAGLLLSWETFNPFSGRPAYQEIADLPIEQRLPLLQSPERREQILSEGDQDNPGMAIMLHAMRSAFPMDEGPVFEPPPSESIAGRAEAEGRDPMEVLYDTMCDLAADSKEGKTRMMAVFFSGYAEGDLDPLREMICDPLTVVGLADGGAHCSMICDASMPTWMLTHWVRDRTRGERLSIEQAIKMLSNDPAQLYGLSDRGVVAEGRRADLNLIELDALSLDLPEVTPDLPTGASRVLQRGHGYRATICAGEITFRDGTPTGARPGQLVRGRR